MKKIEGMLKSGRNIVLLRLLRVAALEARANEKDRAKDNRAYPE
jgi:hypothetical protein